MSSKNMSTAKADPRRALVKALSAGVALAVTAGFSGGCSSVGSSDVNLEPYDYRERHPILISNEPQVFKMRVGESGPAFSPELERALRDYVRDYREHGTGAITIQVPTGSANEIAAARTGHAIHYALVRAGVPHGNIVVAPYVVGDHAKAAALQVSYLQVKAVVPRCGLWPHASDTDFLNRDEFNFGCAQQQNLAAMVADPADLVRPRPMDPPNGGRRANVMQIYVDLGAQGWVPEPIKGLIADETSGVF